MTNRKLNTHFRLVLKSMTLDDLEGPLCTLRDELSNDSGVIENVDFQGIRTLRLRNLRKWSQHYYIVLFRTLSPLHWPQNTWPWMTLNSHFTLNFHYYKQRFRSYFYILTVEPTYITWPVEADRDPQNIWDPRKDCGSVHGSRNIS